MISVNLAHIKRLKCTEHFRNAYFRSRRVRAFLSGYFVELVIYLGFSIMIMHGQKDRSVAFKVREISPWVGSSIATLVNVIFCIWVERGTVREQRIFRKSHTKQRN